MHFQVPAPVMTAIRLLNEAGYSGYPVGGCVRDTLLGTEPHDWDMCTCASPEQMHAVFRDFRTIDTGIKHGTVSVIVDGMPLEITTFRTDGQYLDGRHPENVTFSARVEDDLKRRDFTVNAMALDTVNDRVIDLFGGQEDLKNGVIRCVGDAEERFTEDALRILRALRFSARLGFVIEDKTAAAMRKLRGRLDLVSRERVAQELNGFLMAEGIEDKLIGQKEVLFAAVPELRTMDGCALQDALSFPDVWTQTARAVSLARRDSVTRWAVLLHDIGKPACAVEATDGSRTFPGYETAGAALAGQILSNLKMPRKLTEDVSCLIRYQQRLPDDDTLWPLLATLGEERFFRLLDVQEAEMLSQTAAVTGPAHPLDKFRAAARALLDSGACMALKDLAVKGGDLSRAGITGPAVSRTLNAMLRMVVHRMCPNEKDTLMTQLKEGRLPCGEGLL